MKKGDYMFLVWLILAVVIATILLSFTPLLGKDLLRSGDKTSCQIWVGFRSSAVLGVLSGKGTEDACVTYSEDIKTKNQEEIFSTIAKDMLSCWRDYGSGKIDFYSDWNWGLEQTHCRICYQKNFKEKTIINMTSFQEYLSNNGPSGKTYAEIFTDTPNGKLKFNINTLELDEKNPLYISFVVDKGLDRLGNYVISGLLGSGGILIIAAGVGVAVSAPIVIGGGVVAGVLSYSTLTSENFSPGIFIMDSTGLHNTCNTAYYNVKGKELSQFKNLGGNLFGGEEAERPY